MVRTALRRLIASLSRACLPASRRPVARRPKQVFRPKIELLEERLAPAVDLWTGANFHTDSNWSDGLNWSLGHAPTSSDIAQFSAGNGGPTSVVDGAYTISGLQIDGSWGGSLYVNNNLTLAAGSTNEWDSGNIDVPQGVTLTNNGTLTLNNSGSLTLGSGGTIQNNGNINQQGLGGLGLSGNGNVATTLNNAAGATYNFSASPGTSLSASPTGGVVNNAGLMEKTTGTGTAVIAVPFFNTGTVDAASGTLQIADNSTNTGGTYTAASGATLDLTGGATFNETGTFTATGAGTITLGGGTFAVYNNSATLAIPSTISFQWPGSTVNVPINDTLTVNGNLTFTGTASETLTGGGALIENGVITQSGTGPLVISAGGNGTVATTPSIPKGSVYDFAANSAISGGFGGVITSSGTIEKTAGGGNSAINVALNNSGGTLAVTSGTLTFGTFGGENTGGTFNVSAGAILDLTGGSTVNYSGTYTGSGSGEVLFSSGVLNVTGGTNGATFNLAGNLFVWTGGTIDTAAGNNCTILGNIKITGNGTETLQRGGALNVGSATTAGTVNDTATGNTLTVVSGSTLDISSKGTFNIADDIINGGGLLSNLGSLVKTAGTSGATIAVGTTDNQGKVQVNNGTLLFSGAVDQVFNGALTGGSWTASSTATTASTLDISSATFSTIGLSATVVLTGPNSSFTNLSGLSANQGTFSLLGSASFATGGNFTNSGSLTLSPGSVLTVNGTFTETATSKNTVQIGGTSSSPAFGSIVSTGAVSLGGSLTVTSTVTPAVSSAFEILANGSGSAITGTFSGLPEGSTFTVKVGTTTMTFKISYVGGPGNKNVVITRIS
jgi:hypothetical protein